MASSAERRKAAARAANAERNRRYRRHLKGDHSLCDPARGCGRDEHGEPERPLPAAAPTDSPARDRGEQRPLSERGQALWDEMAPQLGAAHRVLLLEACRLLERLDRLDGLIAGRARRGEWLRIAEGDHGELRVVVDDLLAEARQQATALRGLVAELRQSLPKPKAEPPGRPQPGVKGVGIASLAAAAARRRAASG